MFGIQMKRASGILLLACTAFLVGTTIHAHRQLPDTIASCVRQVLQKGMELLVEVEVLVGSRTDCAA